jgi:asparagine synthase (glutamine-hydrolysing)
VASSPELLRLHPSFRGSLDPFGLAAVLATSGLVAGHTLFSGVTRLDQGHALVARAGQAPVEHEHYVFPVTRDLHEAPFDVCTSEMYEALRAACCRHVPRGIPHTQMLSGGLDSRLIAGVLAREGRSITAMTRGEAHDIEYRCARAVADHLGFEHHLVRHDECGLESLSDAIRWDGLTSSPGTGSSGSGAAALLRFHPVAVTGYLCDSVVGGTHVSWIEKEGTPPIGFEWAWWRVSNWGLSVDVLERLLRRDVFGDAVHEVREAFRRSYEAAGETHHERNYRFGMQYRNRFGNGDVLARLAFGAWPRSPHLDREVFRVSGSIPPAVLARRRLEKNILERYHLDLACLPLDRNSYDWRPLQPRVKDWIQHAVARRTRAFRERFGLLKESRYYFRTYNINGEHWRAIRRMLEPFRERAYEVFERKEFDALLPPPEVDIPARVGIADVAGRKTLLAFLVMLPLLTDGGK